MKHTGPEAISSKKEFPRPTFFSLPGLCEYGEVCVEFENFFLFTMENLEIEGKRMQRVLSIQSHVVRGKCGNASAAFPLG